MVHTFPNSITIDGPASSGKSTIGERLAEQLGYLYFDTGCMYRAVTAVALRRGVEIYSEVQVGALAERIRIEIRPSTADDGRQYTVLADGEDVTWALRDPDVDANVSIVSAYPRVRAILTEEMRRLGERGAVVMVGRDIGTVVMPDAPLKIYLDASVEERARRRHAENVARGQASDYEAVLVSLRERDRIDSKRATAPLRPAYDAHIIDTTGLSPEQVLDSIGQLMNKERQRHDGVR